MKRLMVYTLSLRLQSRREHAYCYKRMTWEARLEHEICDRQILHMIDSSSMLSCSFARTYCDKVLQPENQAVCDAAYER